jgi:hypothetical protein
MMDIFSNNYEKILDAINFDKNKEIQLNNKEVTMEDNRNKIKEKEMQKEIEDALKKDTSKEESSLDSFIDKMRDQKTVSEKAYTDNGALVYASSGSKMVDFNFNLTSKRGESPKQVAEDFLDFYYEDKKMAMRYLFFMRDIREGQGERNTFKIILSEIAKKDKNVAKAVIDLVPEYGRWDDLLPLLDTPLKKDVIQIYKNQLDKDLKNLMDGNKDISLLGKWLPSINASNEDTIRYAKIICGSLGMKQKDYRHMLSDLRKELNIIEKPLAEKDKEKLVSMQEILTSKQNLKYSKALMNIIPEERTEFFNKVLKGEANMNVSVLEPHEIYYRYNGKRGYNYRSVDIDYSYEVMWNQLPNKVTSDKQVLVVRDGSGSMTVPLHGSKGTVLDVASALTVYFSENATGAFKDKFITFSSRPDIVDMSKCNTLADKINLLNRYNDCSNTNLEKTFDLILNTAIANKMTQEEMPANILIISDMQFDSATRGDYDWRTDRYETSYDETLFDTIRKKFEDAGYKIPGLIFWNVNQEKTTIPEIKNELGLVLIGGYSKNNIDMICKNEFIVEQKNEKGEVEKVTLSPEEILYNTLMSERYDIIEERVNNVLSIESQMKNDVR